MEWGGLCGHISPALAQAVFIKGLEATEAASHVCESGPQLQSFHCTQTPPHTSLLPHGVAVFPEG